MRSRALAAILVFCGVLPAAAAPARSDWDVTLGVGAGLRPTFEGSDRNTVRPLPVLAIRWRDIIALGDGGLTAYWRHGRLRVGGGLTFDPGRKDHSSGGIFESRRRPPQGPGHYQRRAGLSRLCRLPAGSGEFPVLGDQVHGRAE